MLLCVNELFHQNRYAALTIYLEVTLFQRKVSSFAHKKEYVCVAALSGGRGSIWTLLDAEPQIVFSALSRDVAVGYKTSISAKSSVLSLFMGRKQHGGRKNEVSGARGLSSCLVTGIVVYGSNVQACMFKQLHFAPPLCMILYFHVMYIM